MRVAQRLREVIDYKFFNLFLVDEVRGGCCGKSLSLQPEEVAAHQLIPFDRAIALPPGAKAIRSTSARQPRFALICRFKTNTEANRCRNRRALTCWRESKIVGVLTIESAEANYFTRDHERV